MSWFHSSSLAPDNYVILPVDAILGVLNRGYRFVSTYLKLLFRKGELFTRFQCISNNLSLVFRKFGLGLGLTLVSVMDPRPSGGVAPKAHHLFVDYVSLL